MLLCPIICTHYWLFRNTGQSNTIVGNGKRFMAMKLINGYKSKESLNYCIN